MGSGVNRVILVGTLGKDPEVRYGPSGTAMVNFPIATNETWNDKEGKRQERTEWHKIVGFGKVAEVCGEHLQKGRQVYIEGKLQTRSFDDKEGVKRYTTEILMQSMQFVGNKSDGAQREQDDGPRFRQPVGDRRGGPAPQREQPQPSYDAGYDQQDDIPF